MDCDCDGMGDGCSCGHLHRSGVRKPWGTHQPRSYACYRHLVEELVEHRLLLACPDTWCVCGCDSGVARVLATLEGNAGRLGETGDLLHSTGDSKLSCELSVRSNCHNFSRRRRLQFRKQRVSACRTRARLQPMVLGSAGVGSWTEPWRANWVCN